MPPCHYSTASPLLSGRYLTFAQREEIAPCREGSWSVYHCSQNQPGGIDDIRGVRRNGATRSGGFEYRALTAA